jgi:peptidoglycan/LPS O-acetylase OafA/YrhL
MTFLLEIVLGGVGAHGLRKRRDWLLAVALVAGAVGCIISIAQFLLIRGIWWFAPWDLLLLPATVALVLVEFAKSAPLQDFRTWLGRSRSDFYG